jgi:hypothetical protein
MSKKILIVLILGIVVIAIIVTGFVFLHDRPRMVTITSVPALTSSTTNSGATTTDCLSGNEIAEVPADEEKQTFYGPLLTSSTIDIDLINEGVATPASSFQITNVDSVYFNPAFRQCDLYILRDFGKNSLPGYNVQLWRYDYTGSGTELFNLFAIASSGVEENFYYPDFRVDPNEKYLALEQGQASSVIIVDPKTTQSLFSLPIATIATQDPAIVAEIGFYPGGWSSDGRYFWFDFFEDADVYGFVRIDTANWSYQAFATPTTTMGGDAFNPDTGMTTYSTNVAPWTADSNSDQYYRDQAIATGQITSFFIDNLLTGQTYLVATTTDPTYYFEPRWISDTQLEYVFPSGATSTYTVP